MFKLAVFVSGRGSNLKSIWKKLCGSDKNIRIEAVISNSKECGAIEFARNEDIPCYFIRNNPANGYVTYEELAEILLDSDTDLIVLAGYLKKIPDNFISQFRNKIINIHPALLPSFGGKGMYGMNVHKAVFEKSCKVSGATIHFVDEVYDNGLIINQKTVDISNAETPQDIAALVLGIEHELLPETIVLFEQNRIKIENNRVYIH